MARRRLEGGPERPANRVRTRPAAVSTSVRLQAEPGGGTRRRVHLLAGTCGPARGSFARRSRPPCTVRPGGVSEGRVKTFGGVEEIKDPGRSSLTLSRRPRRVHAFRVGVPSVRFRKRHITRECKSHFILNVRKRRFPSAKFISYAERLQNVTFILHFFAF